LVFVVAEACDASKAKPAADWAVSSLSAADSVSKGKDDFYLLFAVLFIRRVSGCTDWSRFSGICGCGTFQDLFLPTTMILLRLGCAFPRDWSIIAAVNPYFVMYKIQWKTWLLDRAAYFFFHQLNKVIMSSLLITLLPLMLNQQWSHGYLNKTH
jgi:hypothetical protein